MTAPPMASRTRWFLCKLPQPGEINQHSVLSCGGVDHFNSKTLPIFLLVATELSRSSELISSNLSLHLLVALRLLQPSHQLASNTLRLLPLCCVAVFLKSTRRSHHHGLLVQIAPSGDARQVLARRIIHGRGSLRAHQARFQGPLQALH